MNSNVTSGRKSLIKAAVLAATALGISSAAAAADDGTIDNTGVAPLPSGQFITPTATPGSSLTFLNPGLSDTPSFVANGAIKTALSPDGNTLLVLTSGYNLIPSHNSQYLFVYDVSGAHKQSPLQTQVIQVPDSYAGLVWKPDGSAFYLSGGSTDSVFAYTGSAVLGWTLSATISLGHAPFVPTTSQFYGLVLNGVGFEQESAAAGLGISSDGSVLAVANIYNDSMTVIDTATNKVRLEYDLRPYNTSGSSYNGVAGGEVPFSVAVANNGLAYVSSIRDREVVAVNISGTAGSLITRIPLPGSANSLLVNAGKLYVTQDNSDMVAVIDTTTNLVTEEISTIAPTGVVPAGTKYTGAAANNLALSPDGQALYVTNGGANSVAVIPLAGPAPHQVSGLLPTGWYPNSVSVSSDGSTLYVANGKSDPGSNPAYETSGLQYVLQLEGGTLLTLPVPTSPDTQASLTAQVAQNNGYSVPVNSSDAAIMSALHGKIQHVIYIIKENRTFDQILGDLGNGSNGDPSLTMYGKRVTPNLHSIASNFVTLDNFFCSGEVSGNGWSWSTQSRESDHGTKTIPPNYANRGHSNDSEGLDRNIDVGFPSTAARAAALATVSPQPQVLAGVYTTLAGLIKGGAQNLLPGTGDDFATDGPNGAVQAGHLWDAALRAGLTIRNYGFFLDATPYNLPSAYGGLVPNDHASQGYLQSPFSLGLKVAVSTNPALQPNTDPYFWGFDNAYPDAWRVQEWQREFQTFVPGSATYVPGSNLPNLTLLRLMHDHTGNFGGSDPAVAGLSTPELQQADNDYAVGEVVQTVARSPYAGNTLIFVLEDDAQDGPDHMDAHRSTAYIVGPYVKQRQTVSTRYSTVNMLRTIEDILGLDHLSLNDAYQRPMADVFNVSQAAWTYTATMSPYLKATQIASTTNAGAKEAVQFADNLPAKPARSAKWWARKTRGFDWSDADRLAGKENADHDGTYNEIEWRGVKPGVAYPKHRSGIDLSTGHQVAQAN